MAWTSPAVRDLARLPTRVAQAVFRYVNERLAANPQRLSKPLRGDLAGQRSAVTGDYRVLFSLDEGSRTLHVRRVDHRAHVYRPT